MMKKFLLILISALMVVSLVACGDKATGASKAAPPAAAASDAADDDNAAVADDAEADAPAGDENTPEEQAYADAMSEFITSYEELISTAGSLAAEYDGSEDWFVAFATLYQTSADAANQLTEIAADVPESYQDSHISITAAVAAFSAMMDTFGEAAATYESGDEAGGDELMEQVKILEEAAQSLWDEAVVE